MNTVGYIALIVSLSINVLLTLLVFRQSAVAVLMLDRAHARTTEYTQDLVDRLSARDYNEYQTWKALQEYDTSDLPQAEEAVEMVPTMGPDRGGFGSRLGLSAWHPPDEEEISPEEELE